MKDIQVSISETSHFSFGTSPYYAHQHGLAIDVYQDLNLKNYKVFSPISGRVLKIKTVAAPKPKFAKGLDVDFLILISNLKNSKILWKLMHVKPDVKIKQFIKVGDVLGETIRNGYFAYWSSPHLHLEVRAVDDPIRARGGKNLSLAIEKEDTIKESSKELNTFSIPVKIYSICPEMILARLPENFYYNISLFNGVKARINKLKCILDGGIPHYKIGTVIFNENHSFDKRDPVFLGTHKIGYLHEINGRFGFFKFENVKFLLNNKEIRGISLYLANFLPMIKLIPFKKNEFSFEPRSIQYLKLISSEAI
jgi:hypothetical protein